LANLVQFKRMLMFLFWMIGRGRGLGLMGPLCSRH